MALRLESMPILAFCVENKFFIAFLKGLFFVFYIPGSHNMWLGAQNFSFFPTSSPPPPPPSLPPPPPPLRKREKPDANRDTSESTLTRPVPGGFTVPLRLFVLSLVPPGSSHAGQCQPLTETAYLPVIHSSIKRLARTKLHSLSLFKIE